MTSTLFYQYAVHFAVMITIMLTMAIYLLVSKRNAFGSKLITDQRLRRKAGWVILIYVFVYLANIPLAFFLADNPLLLQMMSLTLDMVLCLPTVLHFLFELLQDRRRWDDRLWWLSALALLPLTGWLLTGHTWWMWVLLGLYLTELGTLIVWYVSGVKTYHRFLADNYADMEHKEIVWSWVVLSTMALNIVAQLLIWFQIDMHVIMTYAYIFHGVDTLFTGIIVWYIDHQEVLEPQAEVATAEEADVMQEPVPEPTEMAQDEEAGETTVAQTAYSLREDIVISKMSQLLQKHCEATRLYLQHDLSLTTVAQACQTNRTYLSLYFASQGTTYYMYINKLRINHFKSLYRKALKKKSGPPTLRQMSKDSGFVSYNTFSRAFLTCTGISVSKWMKQVSHEE